MNEIKIIGPKERKDYPTGAINTTTSSFEHWSKQLSPMLLPAKPIAENMENLWQFSKVYSDHVGPDRNPAPEFFKWQAMGFADSWAHRYPKGKEAIPAYSYWNGNKLGYIEARKQIYIPEYARLVRKTPAYKQLETLYRTQDLILFDFDGYDHDQLGLSLPEVVNDETRIMGHAFVLKMLLQDVI